MNFIRSKGLNHRQFQAFLTEVGSDYDDVIYYSNRDGTTVRYEKYSALIGILTNELEQRCADFVVHYDELKLFSDPFRIDVNDANAMFQLQLIDIQSDSNFSKNENVKTHTRSKLTDEHLTGILRIATSSVPADIDYLCKQKQCQTFH